MDIVNQIFRAKNKGYDISDVEINADINDLRELVDNMTKEKKFIYLLNLYFVLHKKHAVKQNNTLDSMLKKIDYAIALEGSLKLKEISYIHSEAYQAGELKHGTISLVDDGTPVISIITDKDIREKTISNVQEVKARGAKCIIISNEEITGYDHLIQVPEMSNFFQPLVVVPCLQLIAYEVAKLRGCDIDKPKNLAKSVTVE